MFAEQIGNLQIAIVATSWFSGTTEPLYLVPLGQRELYAQANRYNLSLQTASQSCIACGLVHCAIASAGDSAFTCFPTICFRPAEATFISKTER
jgi:hypothetical protein